MKNLVLVVDNLSPFTPDIMGLLTQQGAEAVCTRYDLVKEDVFELASHVILSGRRSSSAHANSHNSRLVRHCLDTGKKLLGICYGAEIIALSLGGTIVRMPAPLRGLEQVKIGRNTPITRTMEVSMNVYESHAFRIARLPEGFISVAHSKSTPYELFCNEKMSTWGTQFHPEKSGAVGATIFRNFISLDDAT